MSRVQSATVITIIILVSMLSLAGTAAAQEELPQSNSCEDAPVIDPGTYSSTLTPEGYDGFRLPDVSQGDYISFELEFDEENIDQIDIEGPKNAPTFTTNNFDRWINPSYSSEELATRGTGLQATSEGSGRIYMENNKPDGFCGTISTDDGGAGGYAFSFDINSEDPPTLATQDEVEELESQIENKEERINELESQLDNADVTIDVTVEPEDQATFQVGGEMGVNVEASGTSASNVALSYAGEEYTASGGEATIPLESAGSQQLDISHEDTTETVTLDVANQETENQNGEDSSEEERTEDQPNTDDSDSSEGESTEQDGITDSDGDGVKDSEDYAPNDPEVQEKSDIESNLGDSIPGFGIVVGLIAIVAMTTIAQRKQQ